MKQAFRLVVLLLLVTGWLLATLSLHVVRTPADLPTLVTKDHLGFTDTYVDTRQWTPDELAKHVALLTRLEKLQKLDLLNHVFKQQPGIDPHVQVMAAYDKASKKQPQTTPSAATQATQAASLFFGLFD